MAKTFYYKLSNSSSMFYDPKSKLKVTNGVPGSTEVKTKKIMDGVRGGHLIEISETEFNAMIAKLPSATQAAVKKDLPKSKPAPAKKEEVEEVVEEEEDDSTEEEEISEERQALLDRLEALKLSKKEKKKALAMDDSDLEDFILEKE